MEGGKNLVLLQVWGEDKLRGRRVALVKEKL